MGRLCQTGNVLSILERYVTLVSCCASSEPTNVGLSPVSSTTNVLVDAIDCFAERIFVCKILRIERIPAIRRDKKS